MFRRAIYATSVLIALVAMSIVPSAETGLVARVSAGQLPPGEWRNELFDPETGKTHCHEQDDDCHV